MVFSILHDVSQDELSLTGPGHGGLLDQLKRHETQYSVPSMYGVLCDNIEQWCNENYIVVIITQFKYNLDNWRRWIKIVIRIYQIAPANQPLLAIKRNNSIDEIKQIET